MQTTLLLPRRLFDNEFRVIITAIELLCKWLVEHRATSHGFNCFSFSSLWHQLLNSTAIQQDEQSHWPTVMIGTMYQLL
eukprot:scaffold34606_cov192-Amphora_coffeaeformis.AAC.5